MAVTTSYLCHVAGPSATNPETRAAATVVLRSPQVPIPSLQSKHLLLLLLFPSDLIFMGWADGPACLTLAGLCGKTDFIVILEKEAMSR